MHMDSNLVGKPLGIWPCGRSGKRRGYYDGS
jgi:hypothetical protein